MISKQLEDAMNDLGKDLVKELVRQLIKADKKATGNLVRSVDYKLIETSNTIILELLSLDYLDIVDQGRKPGKFPPLKSLDKWIVKRHIAPRDKKGRFIPRESVKFLIARSIAKNGIKGINVVKKTIDKVYYNKQKLMEKATEQTLLDMLDKI